MPDYAVQRLNMVESQVRANDVTDVRIHEAMRAIPRERFVPAAKRALAYADAAVEIVPGRFLLDPRTFSKLAQLAEIAGTDVILDVGCGSGYSAAVLAKLGRRVTGLEQDAELVRVASDMLPAVGVSNAAMVQGSLAEGHRGKAPYDVIFVEGAIELVPDTLSSQLAEGGRLVAVMQKGPQGHGCLFLREAGRLGRRQAFDASAPLLPGFRQAAEFVF